jgi:hypothetical protein
VTLVAVVVVVAERVAHRHQNTAELVASAAIAAVAPELVVLGVLDELRVARRE